MDNKTKKWVLAVLTNDDHSTDKELYEYFVKEGKLGLIEAMRCVAQRGNARKDLHYELR